ncbi:MAG: hypothetical protein LQ338_006347 [Usnochroma carphineum]|nr:MAG: hypothetical protein LQ338_006347 [Usnochroma carphineum]
MAPSRQLLVRDDSTFSVLTPTMTPLLIALVVLLITGFSLVAVLFILRSHRKAKLQQEQTLPVHTSPAKRISNHRRLTISAMPYGRNGDGVHIYSEKERFPSPMSSGPPSPVPEIRITLPEEEDDAGKRKSGRVVVVRISEAGGVGLEPYRDDHLPPYDTDDVERFQSLDLDRIGGLKEIPVGAKNQ